MSNVHGITFDEIYPNVYIPQLKYKKLTNNNSFCHYITNATTFFNTHNTNLL